VSFGWGNVVLLAVLDLIGAISSNRVYLPS
jgi:hypothetical protein